MANWSAKLGGIRGGLVRTHSKHVVRRNFAALHWLSTIGAEVFIVLFRGRVMVHGIGEISTCMPFGAVCQFTVIDHTLTLTTAPFPDFTLTQTGIFNAVIVTSRTILADDWNDESLDPPFPWDILGFDSYPRDEGRWTFVLCCTDIEYVFDASWPHVLPHATGRPNGTATTENEA